MKRLAEIMAPAGSYETLQAAIRAGADSVYFGVGRLNMRSASTREFSLEDLKKITAICRKAKVKAYLTLNSVMYDNDLALMRRICDAAKKEGIDAVIACDFAVIEYAHSIGLEVHTSTQANVSNLEAVKVFSRYADVIVLARELKLEQIRHICEGIRKQRITGPSGNPVRIEVFVHGALCVSISGKCYMSLATYNRSANRGECLQNCRRSYKVTDAETGDELEVGNGFVMSPSDLCTIGILDRLTDAGASVFKIEGRGRKADYVYAAVKAYREAADAVAAGTYTQAKVKKWTAELEKVFNRGFWHGGYYLGEKVGEWSGSYGSKASTEKVYVGKCINHFPKAKVGFFLIETGELKKGDGIMVTGPTTGIVELRVQEMKIDDKPVKSARKGDKVTILGMEKVRAGDKLFTVKKRE